MDAIQSPVITLEAGHLLRRRVNTRARARLARMAVGIAWATVTASFCVVVLEASFGYTRSDTPHTPPHVTDVVAGRSPTPGQAMPHPGPAPRPAGD